MIWDERFNAVFPARITDATDVDDVWAHSWVEQFVDPVTGQLVDADPPRTGSSDDSPAYEVNNVRCPNGAIVWMKTRGIGLDNQIVYEFIHPQTTVFVKVVSEQDAWPMYNGSIQTFSARTRAWTTFGDCYLIEANRDELVTGRRYKANLIGQYSGQALYSTFCCGDPPPADPSCTQCSNNSPYNPEVPVEWSVPLTGFGGNCASVTGTVRMPLTGTCIWSYTSGLLSVEFEVGAVTSGYFTLTVTYNSLVSVYRLARTVPGDCCHPRVLSRVSSDCDTSPATLTVTPSCASQCPCDVCDDFETFPFYACATFESTSGSGVLDGVVVNLTRAGPVPGGCIYYLGNLYFGVSPRDRSLAVNVTCEDGDSAYSLGISCVDDWGARQVSTRGVTYGARAALSSYSCSPFTLTFTGVQMDHPSPNVNAVNGEPLMDNGSCGIDGDTYTVTITEAPFSGTGNDCPQADPDCQHCSDHFYPEYYEFTPSGFTGESAAFNNPWKLELRYPGSCDYGTGRAYDAFGSAIPLQVYEGPSGVYYAHILHTSEGISLYGIRATAGAVMSPHTLFPGEVMVHYSVSLTEPYDCCEAQTLTLANNYAGDTAPASIVIVPSCGTSPPNCPSCSLQVPSLFTFTLSTFTGDCTAYNGNYALRRVGETCTYAYYARRVAIVLELLPTSVLLTGNINGVEISYSVTGLDEPYDCCAGLLLSSVDVTDCASAPATLTVVPACFTPTCDNCDAELPDSWEVVIAGMTGDFTKYNGTWTLVAATDCTWRAYSGSVDLYLRVRDDAVELFTESGGNFLYSLAGTAPWDCCVPHELDRETTFGTGDTPATLTVTPDCYLAPCDYCDDTPATITVTFSGGSDGCEVYAGDWEFTHSGGCQWTATLGGRTLVWTLESNGEFWIENAEMEWYGSAGAAPVACCNESMWEATILNNATTLCASPTSMPTVTNVVVGGCPGA